METEKLTSESVENEDRVDAPMQAEMRPIRRKLATSVNRLEMRFDGQTRTHTKN